MDMFEQMLIDDQKALEMELKQVEDQCKKDGKSCNNCGCIRFSGNKCIDMTCWRGYMGGDHDGWVPDGKKSPNAKFQKIKNHENSRNVAKAKDYTYRPFASLKKD